MKTEVKKFLYSKRSLVIASLIMIIMIGENISIYISRNVWRRDSCYYYLDASFLAGRSEGHIPQMIIFWFLPIILLLLFGDKIIDEIKIGYSNTMIVKKSSKRYILDKMKAGFCIGFGTMAISLIVNVIVSAILFRRGVQDYDFIQSIKGVPGLEYSLWQMENPLIAYCIYIIIVSWFSGILTVFVTLLGAVFKDKRIVMAASFFIWFILVSLGFKSVMNIFQPFNEYSFSQQIIIFLISNTLIIVISIISIVVLKKREDYV